MSNEHLDSIVSDHHLAEIANNLVDWELLAPYLELTESEQKEIVEDYRGRYKLQKLQALREWKRKSGGKATYRNLGGICRNHDLVSLAERIESYQCSQAQPGSSQILDTFQRHLVDCYLSSPHPATLQWPPEAIPSLALQAPSTYLDLNLQEAPLVKIQYPTDTQPPQDSFKSVTLPSVLSQGEGSRRMLVYFQGIGGSGKTTLSWHACREWAEKRLLTHFQLLIHVQLSRVKSATTFADLIPYPDKSFRQAVATAIVDQQGRGVCLLVDGLDESTTELLDFMLVDLLRGRFSNAYFPELSFVMTSRPDWRITERLQSVLKTCIVLAGFNRDSLLKFLDNRLGASSKEKAILLKEFRINLAVEGLCCHPVNAAIMSFIIHFICNVPTTQTMLHDCLIKNFLIRLVKSRMRIETPCAIDSLLREDCLPSEICLSFRNLCLLAYTSVLELKRLFTDEDLLQANIKDTLGLLNTRPTITMSGSRQYHSFYHESIQEFLAAVHLSTMEESEQVTAVELFLGNNLVRSQVLPFYAGLTRLSNARCLKVISASLSQIGEIDKAIQQLLWKNKGPRQQAVTFMQCLYECQNDSVMELPETNVPVSQFFRRQVTELIEPDSADDIPPVKYLSFSGVALTPLDCLSLAHYIRAKLVRKETFNLMVHLDYCSIQDVGMQLLLTEMTKGITECTQATVDLSLMHSQFGKESLLSLKQLLQGPINVQLIALANCFDPAIVDLGYALKCIIEGLANNSRCVCKCVDVSKNPFDASHIFHIILLLLTCSKDMTMAFSFSSEVSRLVMPLFSRAVASSSLHYLNLGGSSISDAELDILGENLQENHCLTALAMSHNKFTLPGFHKFLLRFKSNPNSQLCVLLVDSRFAEDDRVKQILKDVNDFRSTLPCDRLAVYSEQMGINYLMLPIMFNDCTVQ